MLFMVNLRISWLVQYLYIDVLYEFDIFIVFCGNVGLDFRVFGIIEFCKFVNARLKFGLLARI